MSLFVEIVSALIGDSLLWLWIVLALFVWQATLGNQTWRRIGLVLLAVFWILSTRVAADAVIGPLESQYGQPSLEAMRQQGVHDVVVLTGGGYPVDGELLTSGLPHASGFRFMSGLEICSQLGGACRMIFSGSAGRGNEDLATAQVMDDLSRRLLPSVPTVSESRSGSTAEHPINLKPILGQEQFILVTSAYHMPRAMGVFLKAGLHPVPYPVDYYGGGGYDWADLLPAAGNLATIEIALHEYVGLVWYRLSGVI